MLKLQIRATMLEKFRRFIQEASEYETEESLLETLTGKFTGNEYTRIGTAFHKIVECGDISESINIDLSVSSWRHENGDNVIKETAESLVKIDDFSVIFNQIQINTALAYKAEIKGCFHEIRAEKTYIINGTEITVSGGADVVLGNIIRDIKTKYSWFKGIGDYTDSVQWKLYCDIFEIPEFYFDVFEFVGYNKEKHGYDVSRLAIKRHDPIPCLVYEGMQSDIEILLSQFIDYLRFRELEHLFKKTIKFDNQTKKICPNCGSKFNGLDCACGFDATSYDPNYD